MGLYSVHSSLQHVQSCYCGLSCCLCQGGGRGRSSSSLWSLRLCWLCCPIHLRLCWISICLLHPLRSLWICWSPIRWILCLWCLPIRLRICPICLWSLPIRLWICLGKVNYFSRKY